MDSPKTCLYCGEPIVGRADKRYCNNICKSRDFRDQGGARTTVVIHHTAGLSKAPVLDNVNPTTPPPAPLVVAPPPPLHSTESPALVPVAPVKSLEQQVDESFATVIAKRQTEEMQRDYLNLIEKFLEREGKLLSEAVLSAMKSEASALLVRYRNHPSVKEGSDQYRKRLESIYTVCDAVEDALDIARQQPFWNDKKGGYQLKGKQRDKMREWLIG